MLQNIQHLVKSNSAVIVGLDNSVHLLFPVSIGAQVFTLALRIFNLCCLLLLIDKYDNVLPFTFIYWLNIMHVSFIW